jgi:hypothetical protein
LAPGPISVVDCFLHYLRPASSRQRICTVSAFESAKHLSGAKPGASIIVSVCATYRTASSNDMRRHARPGPGCRGVNDPMPRCLQAPRTILGIVGYTLVFGDFDPESGPPATAAFVKACRGADSALYLGQSARNCCGPGSLRKILRSLIAERRPLRPRDAPPLVFQRRSRAGTRRQPVVAEIDFGPGPQEDCFYCRA